MVQVIPWDMAKVQQVRELRSRVTIAIYDLEVSGIPEGTYVEKLRRRAVHNFQQACVALGATIDPGDMKFWEEPINEPEPETGDMVHYKAIGCRWFPTTGTIELVGGSRDGEKYTLAPGAVGQPFNVVAPPLDPVWDNTSTGALDVIPAVDIRKITYVPSGWNPEKRIWLYSPERR
jgi:hypothetical protein